MNIINKKNCILKTKRYLYTLSPRLKKINAAAFGIHNFEEIHSKELSAIDLYISNKSVSHYKIVLCATAIMHLMCILYANSNQ